MQKAISLGIIALSLTVTSCGTKSDFVVGTSNHKQKIENIRLQEANGRIRVIADVTSIGKRVIAPIDAGANSLGTSFGSKIIYDNDLEASLGFTMPTQEPRTIVENTQVAGGRSFDGVSEAKVCVGGMGCTAMLPIQ